MVESAYSVSEQNLDVLRLEHISPYYRSFFAEPGIAGAAAPMAADPAAWETVDSPVSSAAGSADTVDFTTKVSAAPGDFRALPPPAHGPGGFPGSPGQSPEPPSLPLKEAMDAYEKSILSATLARLGGNVSAAARELMITRQALQHKIKKYGL